MSAKFTKGNWKIFNERVGVVDESDSQSFGMMQEIACVDMCNFGEQEGRANANLIACAPDMYEMLVDILECAEDSHTEIHHSDLIHSLHDGINRLLKRARGE